MSNNLVGAFNAVIRLQGRPMKLERYGEFAEIDIIAANTNYARNIALLEETSVTGREFIIPIASLTGTDYIPPMKADLIKDVSLGDNTITSVEEMIILGGIAGYRVRTS